MTALLSINDIHTFYCRSHILQGVSLELEAGEVVALLGRNGVGKTTTFRSVMNLTPIQSGSITYAGREISKLRPYALAPMGIGYVPEDRRIFQSHTVSENLQVAAGVHQRSGVWSYERIFGIFPILRERQKQIGTTLSGGQQQMLAIARALMCQPDLLLLDEPSQGLSPGLVDRLLEVISAINSEGVSVLLVEQRLEIPLEVSDRVYLMSKGRMAYQGMTRDFVQNEAVQKEFVTI